MFVIKAMSFRRQNYYSSDLARLGPLEGSIEFQSETQTITTRLTPDQTQRILAVVAESLVEAGQALGVLVTSQVISQVAGVELLGEAK